MRTIPKDSGAALRARGLRLTGPRRVILEVLRGTETHPTAEWLHRLVRRRLPRVSLGTVYRTLRLLVAEGLASEIPGPHARFDANMAAHHHFTCVRCGRIVDVDGPLAEPQAQALRVADRRAHRAQHHASSHRVLRPLPGVPVREGPDTQAVKSP
jgi:Fe2+ or Zn2+ uptake regulation protein